jgi:DHA1 family tetracycline resistance protein-like MFS transporter
MPFIMITVLIDMVAIGLIIPVLAPLIGQLAGGAQNAQAYWYGVVTLAYGLANFIGAPVLGVLSDRYGRRPVLLLGFCGLALSFFGTALASSVWVLLLVRTAAGFLQANAAVAQAYVADISNAEQRARRFGLLGAMFGIGFILGPVLGGVLGAISVQLPFFVAGGLALLNLLYGIWVLPESLPLTRRNAFSWRAANPLASLLVLYRLPAIRALVTAIILASLAQFTMHTVWVVYTQFRFGWGPLENGYSLFAIGLTAAIVQGVLLGRWLRRFGARRLALWGLWSSAAAYTLWGLATQGWMMYAVIFCNVFGFAVAAAIQGLISNAASAQEQGRVMGALAGVNSLSTVLAPMIAGPLLLYVSNLPSRDWRMGAPFFVCGALVAVACVLATWSDRRAAAAADTAQARL